MKFSLDNAFDFGWAGLKGKAISSADDFADASAAYFEVAGSHGKVKSKVSNRIYFVLDGEGEFNIDGGVESVKPDDVVIVPKNTPYDYKATSGVLKMFLVHTPAYSETDEVKLE